MWDARAAAVRQPHAPLVVSVGAEVYYCIHCMHCGAVDPTVELSHALSAHPLAWSACSPALHWAHHLLQVDNSHAELDTMGPRLLGTLEEALAATWGAPDPPDSNQQQQQQPPHGSTSNLALQSVCFRGCIQLLASVYRPQQQPPAAAVLHQAGPSGAQGYSEEAVAQLLLQLVKARSAALQQHGQQAGGIGPLLGAVVGASQLHPATGGGTTHGSKQGPQRIQLLWQDVPALTEGAGNQQQPVLILDLEDVLPAVLAGLGTEQGTVSANSTSSSSSSLAGSWARLMVFSNKEVLFDQLLQLQAAIR